MSRQEELRYIYQTRAAQMDRKMLCEYIDLLEDSNDRLMETLQDISNSRREEEERSDYYMNRDDLD